MSSKCTDIKDGKWAKKCDDKMCNIPTGRCVKNKPARKGVELKEKRIKHQNFIGTKEELKEMKKKIKGEKKEKKEKSPEQKNKHIRFEESANYEEKVPKAITPFDKEEIRALKELKRIKKLEKKLKKLKDKELEKKMKDNIKETEVIDKKILEDDEKYDDDDEKLDEDSVIIVPELVKVVEPVFSNKKYPKSDIIQEFDFSQVTSISAKSFNPKQIHKHYEKFKYEPEKIKKRWDKFKHTVEKNVTTDVKKVGPKELFDIFKIMDIFYFGGAFEYVLKKYNASVIFIAERGRPEIFRGKNNSRVAGFTWPMWKYKGKDNFEGKIAINMHIMDDLFKDPNIEYYFVGDGTEENPVKSFDAMDCLLHTFVHECIHLFNSIFTFNHMHMEKGDLPSLKNNQIKAEKKDNQHGPLFMLMAKHMFNQTSRYHYLNKPLISDKGKENIISDFKKKFKVGDILQHSVQGRIRPVRKEILKFDKSVHGDEVVKIRDLSDRIRKQYGKRFNYQTGKIEKYCINMHEVGKFREYWYKIVNLALLL